MSKFFLAIRDRHGERYIHSGFRMEDMHGTWSVFERRYGGRETQVAAVRRRWRPMGNPYLIAALTIIPIALSTSFNSQRSI